MDYNTKIILSISSIIDDFLNNEKIEITDEEKINIIYLNKFYQSYSHISNHTIENPLIDPDDRLSLFDIIQQINIKILFKIRKCLLDISKNLPYHEYLKYKKYIPSHKELYNLYILRNEQLDFLYRIKYENI